MVQSRGKGLGLSRKKTIFTKGLGSCRFWRGECGGGGASSSALSAGWMRGSKRF
jgi:hypothetical protein